MNGLFRKRGFALPVVLISSIVMMMILLVSLTSITSVSSSIQSQYYAKLADEAAEAGANFAKQCLLNNNFTASWTGAKPLKPNTNCSGDVVSACSLSVCGLIDSDTLKTTFDVGEVSGTGNQRTVTVTGKVQVLRKSNATVIQTVETVKKQRLVRSIDPAATRGVQRYWAFGTAAGLDFGTSGSSVSPISIPCSGSCSAIEGSTIVSKKDGTLQFWTNGLTIWNRNGNVMQNSTGLTANASTTQAAAIFPLDNSETRYVVVTNNTENGVNDAGELYYSIVNMAAQGGLGEVESGSKNVRLGGTDYASEALVAAPKADGSGYWVMTFLPGSTNIVQFSFNNSGVPAGPTLVASPSGIARVGGGSGFGTLNFNDDYSQLVMMAGQHCIGVGACTSPSGLIRVMSFNTQTGAISNLYAWNSYGYGTLGNQGYSADFSPAGNYVYTSSLYPARVARYSIAGTTNSAAIKSSEYYVGNAAVSTSGNAGQGGGQVLAAPDGKMYVADWGANWLSVMNTPDGSSPGWVYGGRSLSSGKQSRYGLPQLVTVYSPRVLSY
jgi:Tfp pilus assembly protein PilV